MLSRLKLEEGWSTLFLVWSLVATAAAALVAADLMDGLEVLMGVGTFAVLTGLLLAKSNFSSRTAHIFALIYGFALVTYLIGATLPGDLTWRERIFDLFDRQFTWLSKAFGGGTSRDGLIFILQTSGIFWLLGYTAAWYTFRKPRVWRVVLPTGVVLLSVIYYYYGTRPLSLFLVIYILLALLYVARTHLVAQEEDWRAASVRYERSEIRFGFIRAGLLVAVVALIAAWSAPALGASTTVGDALYDANQPWRNFQDTWTRLFSSLRSYGTGSNDPYQDTLVLGGPRSVGNDPIMDIYVSEQLPYIYWQALALDTYDGDGGWSIAERETVMHIPDEGVLNTPRLDARQNVTQTVRTYLHNSSTLYGAPAPIGTDRQMFVDLTYDEVGQMEVQGLRSRYLLRAGDTYNVISTVSAADAESLRAASTNYPEWIDTYTRLPDTITPDTEELAVEIMAPYDNTYDKATAVQNWLRENISYNDQIDAAPDDVEPVHYTLFVSQEAYCTYYASAMAVMLRSQGIPARIVNGYAQGEYYEDAGFYRVKANDAHTWVEVYFPEYGWIQFEPTAAIPVVDRPEGAADGADGTGLAAASTNPLTGRDDLLPEDDLGLDEAEIPNSPQLSDLSAVDSELTPEERLAWIIRGVVGVVVLALAGVALLFANRYNNQVESSVERSYGRLESWARWLGIGFRPMHTPHERADMLAAEVPQGRGPIRNLTSYYVLQTFGRQREHAGGFDPKDEWRSLRPLLLRESLRRRLRRNKQ